MKKHLRQLQIVLTRCQNFWFEKSNCFVAEKTDPRRQRTAAALDAKQIDIAPLTYGLHREDQWLC